MPVSPMSEARVVIGRVAGPNKTDVGKRSALVAKGRVIRLLRLRFEADLIVHSESELLLAAEVMFRCLDRHVAEEELDLIELAASQMTETRTCARRSWGASFSIPVASAALLTISQSTFGVIPSPQIFPDLLIALNRQPSLIPLASVQRSSASFTHSGIGTVRIWPAFPWRSAITQCSSRS
jgi:hypothetical protein